MSQLPFLLELRNYFPPDDWRILLLALRQDSNVWQTLEETELGNQALMYLPPQLDKWNPARLSLLGRLEDVGNRLTLLDDLCSYPTPPLNETWEVLVGQAFKEFSQNEIPPRSLMDSGLLALALREQYRIIKDWPGVLNSLDIDLIGKTTLACLYGMISVSHELLQYFLQPTEGLFRPDYVLHILLSNPLSEEQVISIITKLGDKLSSREKILLLKEISTYKTWMAAELARSFLESSREQPDASLPLVLSTEIQKSTWLDFEDLDQQVKKLEDSLELAQWYQVAAKPDLALPILSESLDSILRLRGHISACYALAVTQSCDYGTNCMDESTQASQIKAWKEAVQLVPEAKIYSSSLAQALIREGNIEEARSILENWLPHTPMQAVEPLVEHPAMRLTSSLMALQLGDREGARQAALDTLELLEKGDGLQKSDYLALIRILSNENMHPEVLRASQHALKKFPIDRDLLALLAQAQLRLGIPNEALLNAYSALALNRHPSNCKGDVDSSVICNDNNGLLTSSADNPDDEIRRLVIEGLEAIGGWQVALDERKLLIESVASPTLDDLHAFMYCAMQAEQPEKVIQVGQSLLEIDPEDIEAHQRIAEASLMMGDYQNSIHHFNQVTCLAPAKPASWLGLVKAYRLAGEDEKAINSLRAASQAIPDDPEIHLSLGEIYFERGELTQALASFRCAASLSSDENKVVEDTRTASQRIALRLGQALYKLGHLEEARQVLSRVYENACGNAFDLESQTDNPSICDNLELTQAYASTLLDLNELEKAIPMLIHVARLQPDEPEPALRLAQALLKIKDQPSGAQRAIPFLQRILGINPDGSESGYYEKLATSPDMRAEARSLLAEAYAKVGNWQQSLDAYRRALDEPLNREPEQQNRLSLGLGLVALRLDQPEMAVAALEEAAQTKLSDTEILRALAEAYLASGLPRDAYHSAKKVLDLKPDDIDTLLWFSNLGGQILSEPAVSQIPVEETVKLALNKVSELNPDRPDYLFRLAEISRKVGNNSMALESLRKLEKTSDVAKWLSPLELFRVAKALRELGEAQLAVSFLERWIKEYKETFQTEAEKAKELPELYQELSSAYQSIGDLEAAQQAVEQALLLEGTSIELYLQKANILIELHQLEAARSTLEKALEISPLDNTAHFQLAQVLRMLGELAPAMSHMEQIINSKSASLEPTFQHQLLLSAAELAFSMLRPKKAFTYLKELLPQANMLNHEFHCVSLCAEIALETSDIDLASQKAELLEKISPNHPGSQGIIARLCAMQGDREKGNRIYHSAARLLPEYCLAQDWQKSPNNEPLETVNCEKPSKDHFFSLLSVGLAALEFQEWEDALSILRQLTELAPFSPVAHLKLAQALVIRAEAQNLYQDLEVLEHAVGESVLSEEAHQLFISSMQKAALGTFGSTDEINNIEDWDDDECRCTLALWLARGKAIFNPDLETFQLFRNILLKISPKPDDIAAFLSFIRRIEKQEETLEPEEIEWQSYLEAQESYLHPLVQMQLSLTDPDSCKALKIAEEAAEIALKSSIRWPKMPMFYYLRARLARIEGVLSKAMEAIQKALDIWPEEARWHFLAFQIFDSVDPASGLPDQTKALLHLEQATKLEPENVANHMALGFAYFQGSQFQRSSKAFEKASQLDPQQPNTWLLLARSQQAIGDLQGAANSSERAIECMTDPIEALLLRGEISLQAQNPRGALSRAQTILRSHKDHPIALYLLARAMIALDRPKEALEALEKTMRLQGNPHSLQMERLLLIRRIHGVDIAIKEIRILSNKEPDQPEYSALLAEWLWETEKNEEAIQISRQVLQENESSLSMSHRGNLYFIIGKHMHQIGQLDQAIFHLSEAIESSPDILNFYLELGRVYQDRRENKQALKIYQKAINIAGDDYRPFYQAGVVLKDNKDYVASESMLRKAAQLAPNEVSVHRLLGAVVALNLVHNHRLAAIEK